MKEHLSEHERRRPRFERNEKLEALLLELNTLLGPLERQTLDDHRKPVQPITLVVGSPRSGTTLVFQWLASLGLFSYPTNWLSRFWNAPYIGAKLQRLLTDPEYQFGHEFAELEQASFSFESTLGKTRGLLAPNEFWYFWRRFFPFKAVHYLSDDELGNVDTATFTAELAAIEAALGKPLTMKAMIVNANIPFVNSVLEKVVFLFVKRHPFYNAQSLLDARRAFSGHLDDWYSFRPRQYPSLRQLDPISQVTGQIYYFNEEIEHALSQIDHNRWLQIDYEDFCSDPATIYAALIQKLRNQGQVVERSYDGPSNFELRNSVKVDAKTSQQISDAWKRLSFEEISP
jgi:LPS sulfotransferase NodH